MLCRAAAPLCSATMHGVVQASRSRPLPRTPQVGVTAMLIASKYEEIWAPEVRDFVYISDKAYTRDQILNMEKVRPRARLLLLLWAQCYGCSSLAASFSICTMQPALAHHHPPPCFRTRVACRSCSTCCAST